MPVERSFRNAKSANVFDALPRQLKVFVIFCLASILPSVGGAYSTTVSQDVRELDRLTDWRISSKGLPEPIAETPEQVCQIEHLDNYTRRRVDHEVDKELTNAEATSRIWTGAYWRFFRRVAGHGSLQEQTMAGFLT
jgi:hypothetical protein